MGAQRFRRLLDVEDFRPALHLAGVNRQISAALGKEPQAKGSAPSFDVGDQPRPLKVGKDLDLEAVLNFSFFVRALSR